MELKIYVYVQVKLRMDIQRAFVILLDVLENIEQAQFLRLVACNRKTSLRNPRLFPSFLGLDTSGKKN